MEVTQEDLQPGNEPTLKVTLGELDFVQKERQYYGKKQFKKFESEAVTTAVYSSERRHRQTK